MSIQVNINIDNELGFVDAFRVDFTSFVEIKNDKMRQFAMRNKKKKVNWRDHDTVQYITKSFKHKEDDRLMRFDERFNMLHDNKESPRPAVAKFLADDLMNYKSFHLSNFLVTIDEFNREQMRHLFESVLLLE